MLFLDALIRFASVGLLLLLVFFALRDQSRNTRGWLFVLLCISLIAQLLASAPHDYGLSSITLLIFGLLNAPNTILAWLFIKALADDDFSMTPIYWFLAALWCIPLWIGRFDEHGFYNLVTSTHVNILNFFALSLFIYLGYHIIKGRRDDLVEPRRRLRFIIVIAMISVAIVSIASEFFLQFHASSLLKAALMLMLLMTVYLWMLQIRPDYLIFNESPSTYKPSSVQVSHKDTKLYEKLLSEMTNNKAWIEPNLTIPKLAKRLAVSEHRLRKLINQSLGFRNFSAFINSYRIDAVKTAFSTPETSDLPILTIALNAGFNSLTPFNRAFKNSEGMTPKAYRKQLTTNLN